MELEISIKACNRVKQDLLAGLNGIIPEQNIEETADNHDSSSLVLNFVLEAKSPDEILQGIAAVVTKLENHYSDEHGIDMQVRNIACSEPSLCTAEPGKPFSPVEGIHIIPWNDRLKTTPRNDDILLDPAHAFGSGLHPSTRLCLQLMIEVAEQDFKKNTSYSVLDIGCGTGILSIAALRLGAAKTLGIEIDPDTVQVARRNIQLNELERSAEIIEGSWQDISGNFDLIVANLVPSVLLKVAPKMANLLTANGLVITSGFPKTHHEKLLDIFTMSNLHLIKGSSLEKWGAMLLGKAN
jgi:ribosomal protein L11 methylase PrmA